MYKLFVGVSDYQISTGYTYCIVNICETFGGTGCCLGISFLSFLVACFCCLRERPGGGGTSSSLKVPISNNKNQKHNSILLSILITVPTITPY